MILTIALLIFAVLLFFIPVPELYRKFRNIGALVLVGLSGLALLAGAFNYNEAGYCRHVRTIFGEESGICSTGWYFAGWGTSSAWPHYITVANLASVEPSTADGSSIDGPYTVRLSDNWTGDVTQTTRFAIPQDDAQFLAMARTFRSPERLITTTLKPAVLATLDSVSNMFTMEEYWSGGRRDEFKNEFKLGIEQGRAKVRRVKVSEAAHLTSGGAAPSDSAVVEDTSETGDGELRSYVVEKEKDAANNDIRIPHDFSEIGIVVSSAILESIDPDDVYEEQIGDRKAAASRRVVAREKRLEQEEQRLLAIQEGETEIAKKQAGAKVVQIEQLTEADTKKKLALVDAERLREEARIAQETSKINLEKTKIDAEAVTVSADAEAYAKKAILEADGALAQKLTVWLEAQKVWASAAASINVPTTVFGATGSNGSALGTVGEFMSLMTAKAASDLALDMKVN